MRAAVRNVDVDLEAVPPPPGRSDPVRRGGRLLRRAHVAGRRIPDSRPRARDHVLRVAGRIARIARNHRPFGAVTSLPGALRRGVEPQERRRTASGRREIEAIAGARYQGLARKLAIELHEDHLARPRAQVDALRRRPAGVARAGDVSLAGRGAHVDPVIRRAAHWRPGEGHRPLCDSFSGSFDADRTATQNPAPSQLSNPLSTTVTLVTTLVVPAYPEIRFGSSSHCGVPEGGVGTLKLIWYRPGYPGVSPANW